MKTTAAIFAFFAWSVSVMAIEYRPMTIVGKHWQWGLEKCEANKGLKSLTITMEFQVVATCKKRINGKPVQFFYYAMNDQRRLAK